MCTFLSSVKHILFLPVHHWLHHHRDWGNSRHRYGHTNCNRQQMAFLPNSHRKCLLQHTPMQNTRLELPSCGMKPILLKKKGSSCFLGGKAAHVHRARAACARPGAPVMCGTTLTTVVPHRVCQGHKGYKTHLPWQGREIWTRFPSTGRRERNLLTHALNKWTDYPLTRELHRMKLC